MEPFKPLFATHEEWWKALAEEKTPYDYACSICGQSPVGATSSVWMAGVCYSCWHAHEVWSKV